MRLFNMPAGSRQELVTDWVGVLCPSRSIVVEREVECVIEATDDIEMCEDGVVRRRFISTPPIGPDGDLWLPDYDPVWCI